MEIKSVGISSLRKNPKNARSHNRRNIEAIKNSLRVFGQQKPVVVGQDGVVYAGNGTVESAIELGWSEIDCVVTTLGPAEAEAYGIADNRLNELSDWDVDALQKLIEGIDDDALKSAIGFDGPEIDELLEMASAGEGGDAGYHLGIDAKRSAPVVRILISVENAQRFEEAMAKTGMENREEALMAIIDGWEKR